MTEPPRMLTLPADLGAKARRRGMINPIPPSTSGNGSEPRSGWERIDLNDDSLAIKPAPPELHPLIYSGLRHALSGPPEATKTLLAYKILLDIVAKDLLAAIIDFEMGANAARILLDELGATPELRSRIRYHQDVPGPPTAEVLETLQFCSIVLIDSSVGAFDASGLDDNARKDVEKWARAWIRPLFNAGIATLVLDHVTKNAGTRGKFQIGSERKTGGVDVHIGVEPVNQLKRGGKAIVKLRTHKDRRGFLDRPYSYSVDLVSHPETHRIEVTMNKIINTVDDEGHWRPTILMERVSRFLELGGEWSRTEIGKRVKGNGAKKLEAIDFLIHDGYAVEKDGERGSKLTSSVSPYRKETDPFLTPSSPLPEGVTTTPSSLSPFGEGEGVGDANGNGSTPSPSEIDRLEELARSYGLVTEHYDDTNTP